MKVLRPNTGLENREVQGDFQKLPTRKHSDYAREFNLDDIKNRKFKKEINLVKSR